MRKYIQYDYYSALCSLSQFDRPGRIHSSVKQQTVYMCACPTRIVSWYRYTHPLYIVGSYLLRQSYIRNNLQLKVQIHSKAIFFTKINYWGKRTNKRTNERTKRRRIFAAGIFWKKCINRRQSPKKSDSMTAWTSLDHNSPHRTGPWEPLGLISAPENLVILVLSETARGRTIVKQLSPAYFAWAG